MPMPVISIAQMREWEKTTWAGGESEAEVIRRVGRAVAEHALRLTRPGDFILVLAGKGNNGADARSTLEHFEDRRVDVLDVNNPEADLTELGALLLLRPKLVIDGLFGVGVNRPLDAHWIKFIQRLNAARLDVLAIDAPSGLNADSGEPQGAAIDATVTLTVGAPKTGLLKPSAWPHVGRLEVLTQIGLVPCPFESELNWTLPEDFAGLPPRRPVASHKGDAGRLAIIAGSVGYHGAAVLAARGAQRARPGLITLCPHESAYAPAAAQLQAVMVQPWSVDIPFAQDFNALLAGPGLAAPEVPEALKETIRRLWREGAPAMVVDASALAWLPAGATPDNAVRVITPHPGEAARLLKKSAAEIQADRPRAVRELSKQFGGCFVVLKGHQTLVGRSRGAIFVNSSGNPHLAQGGSGDVLGGYLAGLLTQPLWRADPLVALRYGIWQHGATADSLQVSKPNWVVEDLVETLGLAG